MLPQNRDLLCVRCGMFRTPAGGNAGGMVVFSVPLALLLIAAAPLFLLETPGWFPAVRLALTGCRVGVQGRTRTRTTSPEGRTARAMRPQRRRAGGLAIRARPR